MISNDHTLKCGNRGKVDGGADTCYNDEDSQKRTGVGAMCGICGFIGKQKGTWNREEVLEEMKESIRHRGPDDGGSWIRGDAALGFRRLSIIDLATGAQPMVNETGDKALVFNGEIYNYRPLREELLQAGHVFATRADTEVLIHGYEEWGSGLLTRLRGMFAFLIWDGERQEVFAARDYFGIKPLHYAMVDGSLVFASEIKAILKYPGYRKELNEEAMEQFLSFQYSAMEESFFKGIYQLPPGSSLHWKAGDASPEIRRYFDPALAPEQGAGEADWAEKVEKALADSVGAHMIADVEVGTFLSGGVDSSLIASEFRGQRAYTVGFGREGGRYSEIHFARQTAQRCRLEHKSREIGEEEFWDAVPDVLYYMDEPLGDASAVPLYFLSTEAARDVKVVLSGEGSDELFGGYRIYCEPESLRRYQRLPLCLRKALAAVARRLPNIRGRQFLIRGSKSLEERFIGNANIFSYEERRELLQNPTAAKNPQEFLAAEYEKNKGLTDAGRMQEIDLRHWLPGDILRKADRMSMAHSLEVRVPFLDRDVFALARRLPPDMKQRGPVTKYIMREVAARHMDADTSARPKLGFPVPIRHWMRGEAGQARLRKAFAGEAARKYFRQEKLEALLQEHLRETADNSRKLWTVYVFCVWYDVYFGGCRTGRDGGRQESTV